MKTRSLRFSLTLTAALHIAVHAQPLLQYTPVITGLNAPIDIVNAGDGSNRMFVVQRAGTIAVYNASFGYIRDFLTVTGISTAGEGGLLSMAFHPAYAANGYFYVYYTLPDNSLEIARYQVSSNPDSADVASKQVVLNIPHPVNTNHNGGKLLFGQDGYLYLGTGDGGGAGDVPNNAQNGNSLLGKMLRLNVTTTPAGPFYTIPPTNPYVSDPNVLDEVWAMGLRNPFRWSFDRSTHDMWLSDVGQGAFEELNFQPAASAGGINYGWRCYEANAAYNTAGCLPAASYTAPIFNYGHNNTTGGFAITGGFVYRGPDFPALTGYYVCADYISGNQWVINDNGAGGWNIFQQNVAGLPANVVAYGETENGALYAASLTTGNVYQVGVSAVLPLTLTGFSGFHREGTSYLDWHTGSEKALHRFEVEYSGNGIDYLYAGSVAAANNPAGAAYRFQHVLKTDRPVFYRLKMIDLGGQFRYSNIISLAPGKSGTDVLYPNPLKNAVLHAWLEHDFSELVVENMSGAIVHREALSGRTGKQAFDLGRLPQGFYLVHLKGTDQHKMEKLVIQ